MTGGAAERTHGPVHSIFTILFRIAFDLAEQSLETETQHLFVADYAVIAVDAASDGGPFFFRFRLLAGQKGSFSDFSRALNGGADIYEFKSASKQENHTVRAILHYEF